MFAEDISEDFSEEGRYHFYCRKMHFPAEKMHFPAESTVFGGGTWQETRRKLQEGLRVQESRTPANFHKIFSLRKEELRSDRPVASADEVVSVGDKVRAVFPKGPLEEGTRPPPPPRQDSALQEWPRQTKPKKGQFMNFSQGHSGTKVQC